MVNKIFDSFFFWGGGELGKPLLTCYEATGRKSPFFGGQVSKKCNGKCSQPDRSNDDLGWGRQWFLRHSLKRSKITTGWKALAFFRPELLKHPTRAIVGEWSVPQNPFPPDLRSIKDLALLICERDCTIPLGEKLSLPIMGIPHVATTPYTWYRDTATAFNTAHLGLMCAILQAAVASGSGDYSPNDTSEGYPVRMALLLRFNFTSGIWL